VTQATFSLRLKVVKFGWFSRYPYYNDEIAATGRAAKKQNFSYSV